MRRVLACSATATGWDEPGAGFSVDPAATGSESYPTKLPLLRPGHYPADLIFFTRREIFDPPLGLLRRQHQLHRQRSLGGLKDTAVGGVALDVMAGLQVITAQLPGRRLLAKRLLVDQGAKLGQAMAG